MPALIALKTFPYASGSVVAGEVFDARSAFDATALIAAHLAIPEDSVSDEDIVMLIAHESDQPVRRRRRARQVAAAG